MVGLTAPAQTTRSSAYLPLARKYRPSKFSDMVGQDATAQAIANAIRLGRQPQAVIFAGVRGVGKTTTARLYAKALNCSLGAEFERCNGCESCRAVAIGTHEDVLEIDGASNTGVDDVRALRETVGYVPQRSRFKVYIIDEVHMLSQSAFNALLKTLEEPPAHVVFIFATTELAKIPRTIQSRCQIFQLQKISSAMIASRIEAVLKAESIQADPRAVAIIAREGHGSMRDALTLTDHVLALGNGVVSLDAVREVVVQASSAVWLDLLAALSRRDVSATLSTIQKLDQEGVEFLVAAEELARFARHGFVLAGISAQATAAPVGHELAEFFDTLDDAELARLREIVGTARPFDLNRIFRTFVQCRMMMDGSGLDRWIFENHAIEWCLDPGLPDLTQLNLHGLQVTKDSERPIRSLQQPVSQQPAAQHPVPQQSATQKPATQQPAPQQTGATKPLPPKDMPVKGEFPPDWNALIEAWKRLKPLQARKLEEVHPLEYGPGKMVLGVPQQSFAGAALLGKDEQQRVREQFAEMFGFKGTLQVVPLEPARTARVEPARPSQVAPPKTPQATSQAAADVIPESVLETREREKIAERGRVIEAARESTLTKEALAILGGKIEDIRVTDPSLT